MSAPQPLVLRDLPESNDTRYREPFRAVNPHRFNRRLAVMRCAVVAFVVSVVNIAIPAGAQSSGAATDANRVEHVRTNGVVADYFRAHTTAPAPGMIVLGGSEGGLNPFMARESALLAVHGYNVLQVSYFGEQGQPHELQLIPLETITRAVDWLATRPEVDASRIGIIGASRGAEVALLIASRYPEIKAVVAAAPSNVAWAAINPPTWQPISSWMENGRPVPFLPFGRSNPSNKLRGWYESGLAAATGHEDAFIPVEKINGPILLICGEKDTLWPSCPMADAIKARLGAHDFRYAVTLLDYPEAGHVVLGPSAVIPSMNPAAVTSLGGTMEATAAAFNESWPRAVAFLDRALQPDLVGAHPGQLSPGPAPYSTVTDFAKLRGLSMSHPLFSATW